MLFESIDPLERAIRPLGLDGPLVKIGEHNVKDGLWRLIDHFHSVKANRDGGETTEVETQSPRPAYRLGHAAGIFLPATRPGFHHRDARAHDKILFHSFGMLFDFAEHCPDKFWICYIPGRANKLDRSQRFQDAENGTDADSSGC
jgi:hypothetical protein